jgi:hypothetical protein
MEEICKATITMGDSKITLEGPAGFVQAQIEKFAGNQQTIATLGETGAGNGRSTQASTEKQFVAEKRPRGHHEIATVLAFALTESGTREFTEEDIRRAYLRAEVRPPKYVSQALRDAKNKFDYITTGSKRGTYRLTNHGDRTIRFDLPRSAG